MSSPLSFNTEYKLSDAEFEQYGINEHTGMSSFLEYADSRFSVMHHTGKINDNRFSSWTVRRVAEDSLLPPLGERVEWPQEKISALRIIAGRSANPQYRNYHFEVSFTQTSSGWRYFVLTTKR